MTVNKLEPDNGTPNDELFTVAGMFDGSLYKLLCAWRCRCLSVC